MGLGIQGKSEINFGGSTMERGNLGRSTIGFAGRDCNRYLRTSKCRKTVESNSCPAGITVLRLETVVCGNQEGQCVGRKTLTAGGWTP